MKKRNGFTLIELIVTMAIAAIVLSIAVPSYQASVQNNRKTTSINALATALQLARSTAITRRVTVTICKSNDTANASPTCRNGGGSGDWSQGWMVFTNPDNDTVLDPGETLLRVQGALDGNASFIGNNNVVNQISFQSSGLARGSNGTITHCDARGAADASALVISVGGQVRHAVDTDADNIVDVQGANISCP